MTHSYTVRLRAVFLALVTLVIASSSLMAQWSELPALPEVRTYPMQTALNGKLYVFGGMDAQGAPQTEAWVIDLANPGLGWSQIADMPEDRGAGYATTVNGKIYIVGGVGIASTVVGRARTLEYDATANTYTPKATMSAGTWFGAGATAGTKIVFAGGLARVGTQNTPVNPTQVYDVTTDTWTLAGNLTNTWYYGHAVGIGNDVYFFGGRNSTQINGTVLKLTGATGSWATVAGDAMKDFVYDGSIGIAGGKVYLAGGVGPTGVLASTQVYDPVAKTWAYSYGLPVVSQGTSVMPEANGSLYLVGGTSGKVLKLDLSNLVAIASVSPTDVYIAAQAGGSGSKIFTIGNTGAADLTGTIEVPTSASWLTVSSSTVNLAASGSDNITVSADASNLAAGTYNATINVRTNDLDNPTIPVNVHLYVVTKLVSQETKVVIEEATGQWCGPCGAYGGPLMRQITENYGDRMIGIAYHDRGGRGATADVMATTATETMNRKLDLNAFPTATILRRQWTPGTKRVDWNDWEATMELAFQQFPVAQVAIEVMAYSYDASTKRVTAKLKISTADALPFPAGTTLRLSGIVTEDGLMYDQYQAPENPWRHDHVARSFWPNNDGQTVALPAGTVTDGVLMPGKEIIVNASFAVTGVADPANAHVDWLVHLNSGTTLGPILQGRQIGLTETITEGGSGPAISVTGDVAQKSINVGETASFTTAVKNLTDAPLQVTFDRVTNTLPNSSWSSQLCVNGDCSPSSTNSVSFTVTPGATVNFRVNVVGGSESATGVVGVRVTAGDTTVSKTYTVVTGVSGIAAETGSDASLGLSAYPNPTDAPARVEFNVPTSGMATLDLFAGTGEKVTTLFSGRSDAGRHSVNVDLAGVPAGVYTLVLTTGGRRAASSISVVR